MRMQQEDARGHLEYYFNDDESEFLKLRKRTVYWIGFFYTVIIIIALISGITGFQGARSSKVIPMTGIRSIYILTVLLCMFLSYHNRINIAENVLVFTSMLAVLTNFLFGTSDYNSLSLVFILTSSVLPIQMINLLIKVKKHKFILNLTVVLIFYSIGFYLLLILPEEEKADISVILFTASFLFMMLILPVYVGTIVKNSLDDIILHKSLFDAHTGLKK